MNQTDKQLWMDRITRVLAELKKEPQGERTSTGGAREVRQAQTEDK